MGKQEQRTCVFEVWQRFSFALFGSQQRAAQ